MARSRREQRVELQQVTQSKPEEKVKPEEQSRREGQASVGAPLSGTQSVSNEASARGFSQDPSPFSRRPRLAPDSSAYRELVAIAAYYRAERRGFEPGGEVTDWLEAEREVAARLDGPAQP